MSDLEKRRSDVAFWQRKYERDRSKYARGMLKNASDRLKLAEIDAENKRIEFWDCPQCGEPHDSRIVCKCYSRRF